MSQLRTMIHTAPLAQIADELRTGRRDLESYLDTLRERTESVEPQIEALLAEPDRWDRLDREAGTLEERYPDAATRPPLYGVPVGVKDIFHVDGLPTKAGSDLPPTAVAGPEAASVTALREAGALVFGKTVTTEFAYSVPGPTRNPHDTDHTPGGSSSGSAAGVAAGLFPLALGTQTVGSVIRPAAFCGIVGVKPSFGRIPTMGVIPFSTSVDHVGLFTQDVAGAGLAAAVLYDDWDVRPDPRNRPTIGVPEGPYLEQAESRGLDALEEQLDALEEAGYDVHRVPALEDIEAINERHRKLTAADMAMAHHEWFTEYGDRYAEPTAELIRTGRAVTVETWADARAGRHALREELLSRMDEYGIDIWACPAAPGPAPEGIDSTGDPAMNLPWTHSGLPVITLPAGRVDGLPVGLQCVGRFGDDETLLAWADELVRALPDIA